MAVLGERQVVVDCDVLQADAGPALEHLRRLPSLHDSLNSPGGSGKADAHPLHSYCAAISVAIVAHAGADCLLRGRMPRST